MKKDMTYKVFIDDKLRPIDIYYKTNNPIYHDEIVHCRNYDEFVQCVEERFKDGSYPGFVSFDYLLTNVMMQITDTYEVHYNDEAYAQDGVDCANWLVNFMLKNNLPLPKYIVHDTNTRGRTLIQKVFNSATPNVVSDPFVSPTPTPVVSIPIIETPVKEVKPVIETPKVTEKVKEVKSTPVDEDKKEKDKIVILQQRYWDGLKTYLEKNKSSVNIKKTYPQFYINLPIGKSGSHVSIAVNSREPKNIILGLCFMGETSKTNFDKLKKLCYNESMKEMNGLFWDRMDGKKMTHIYLKNECDFTNENDWNNQFKWFMVNMEKMFNFFKPYIKDNF